MSSQAKLVLGAACAFTLGIIGYVHYKQQLDRYQMHQGVVRDMEQRQKRKQENLYNLQQQIELTKEIRKQQQQPQQPAILNN